MNVERAPNDQFVTYGKNFASLTSIKSQIKFSGSQKLNFSWFIAAFWLLIFYFSLLFKTFLFMYQ